MESRISVHSAEWVACDRPPESIVPRSPEKLARPACPSLLHPTLHPSLTRRTHSKSRHVVLVLVPATLSCVLDLCSSVSPCPRAVCSAAPGPALPSAPPTAHLPPAHTRGTPQPLRAPRRRSGSRRGELERDWKDDGRGRGTYTNERGGREAVSSGRLEASISSGPSHRQTSMG